jgi:hypothetical protein
VAAYNLKNSKKEYIMNTKPNNKMQSPMGKQSEEKQAHTGKKPAMGAQSPADRSSSSSLHGEKSSQTGKQAHTGSERSGGMTGAKNLCDKTDKTCNKCNCTKTENYCFKCNKK